MKEKRICIYLFYIPMKTPIKHGHTLSFDSVVSNVLTIWYHFYFEQWNPKNYFFKSRKIPVYCNSKYGLRPLKLKTFFVHFESAFIKEFFFNLLMIGIVFPHLPTVCRHLFSKFCFISLIFQNLSLDRKIYPQ